MDLNAVFNALDTKTDDELHTIAQVARIKNHRNLSTTDLIDAIINRL